MEVTMNIEERKWEIMYDQEALQTRIKELGSQIKNYYQERKYCQEQHYHSTK